MPVRIVTILGRLKQDLADGLSREAIEQACKQEKYSWRAADARSGHDRLSVYPPDPSRQHRLFARGPLRPMELHRCRLLCRAEAAPPGGPPPPCCADRRECPDGDDGPIDLARPPGLAPRRVELLDARHPRAAGGIRPAQRPAAGMRLPGRQVSGTLRPGHRHAPAGRAGAAPLARDGAMRRGHLRSEPRRHRAG